MQRSCSRPWNCVWPNSTPDRPREVRDRAGHRCSAAIIPRRADRSSAFPPVSFPLHCPAGPSPLRAGYSVDRSTARHRLIRNCYERSECLNRIQTKRAVRRRRRTAARERPPHRAPRRIGLDFHHRFALFPAENDRSRLANPHGVGDRGLLGTEPEEKAKSFDQEVGRRRRVARESEFGQTLDAPHPRVGTCQHLTQSARSGGPLALTAGPACLFHFLFTSGADAQARATADPRLRVGLRLRHLLQAR
jgi:hypothetical protein